MTATIERAQRKGGYGASNGNAHNLFHGINLRGIGDLTPNNEDNQGYVFFTKPCMNLLTENISLVRKLQYLTTTNTDSLAATIKSTLMPFREANFYSNDLTRSSAVDDRNPFIPFLSNTLLSLTGWPDEVTDVMDSAEGWRKQIHGHVDAVPELFGTFDLTASFVNKEGDPHSVLFSAWREYMTRVANGDIVPFPEMIALDEIDYMTRIYVVVLDPTKRFVQKIACTGGSFPTAVPTAAAFNYSAEKVFDEENNNLDIPFKCYGAMYNDPAIVGAFNDTVVDFNGEMADGKREEAFRLLTTGEKIIFNDAGYPRINSETLELEWWIDKSTYNAVLRELEE